MLLLVAGVASADAGDQALIQQAEKVVQDGLKDPESARFKGEFVSRTGNGAWVCGLVNAKNSYGGYEGYQAFGVRNGIVYGLELPGAERSISQQLLKSNCSAVH